jgi:PhnB protein
MVMNMSMKLGSATVMASDSPESMFSKPQGFRVSISPSSREEFDRVHDALAKDAESVEMALGETSWAERFANVHRQVRHALDAELRRQQETRLRERTR